MNIINKYIVIGIISLFLFKSAAAQEANGFRDMKWGDPQTEQFTKLAFSDKFMRRKSDILKIGEASLNSIYYSFDNNQLSAVIISFYGYENVGSLKNALEAKYGAPDKSYISLGDYMWINHPTTTISFDYTSYSKSGQVILMSKEMIDKKINEDKIKARQAAEDL